jgi:peptide deformylase
MVVFMSRLQIIKGGQPILRKPTRQIDNIDGGVKKLSDTMFKIMREAKGVGLAANQIGFSRSMFVYELGDARGTVINPVITEVSQELVMDDEACLSLPGKNFRLHRPKVIWVTALDLETGNEVHYEAQDYLARMFAHEIDHLNGRLLSDGV